jgi:hypothetical protein
MSDEEILSRPFWPKNWWQLFAVLFACCGCLGFILYKPIMAARPVPPGNLCLSNLKQLSTATAIYCMDSNDKLPQENWITLLEPYTKRGPLSDCPELSSAEKHFGYAYKFGLCGLNFEEFKDAATTVLYFETDALAKDLVANLAARTQTRHEGLSAVSFVDTHAKRLPADAKLK